MAMMPNLVRVYGRNLFHCFSFLLDGIFLLQGPLCPCEMTEIVDACLEPGGAKTGSGCSLGGKEEG